MLDAPVVVLGYRYTSTAIRGTEPLPSTQDVAADLDGSPGTRVPHVWLNRADRRLSTLDLVAGRWTVLAGPEGAPWREAATAAARHAGTELACSRVGVDIGDPEDRFATAAGVGRDGALLVRPDGFVGWRSPTAAGASELSAVLASLIGRT